LAPTPQIVRGYNPRMAPFNPPFLKEESRKPKRKIGRKSSQRESKLKKEVWNKKVKGKENRG